MGIARSADVQPQDNLWLRCCASCLLGIYCVASGSSHKGRGLVTGWLQWKQTPRGLCGRLIRHSGAGVVLQSFFRRRPSSAALTDCWCSSLQGEGTLGGRGLPSHRGHGCASPAAGNPGRHHDGSLGGAPRQASTTRPQVASSARVWQMKPPLAHLCL